MQPVKQSTAMTEMQSFINAMKSSMMMVGGNTVEEKLDWFIKEVSSKAAELLSKERSQIVDAFDEGGDNALQIGKPDFTDGEQYFTETYQ